MSDARGASDAHTARMPSKAPSPGFHGAGLALDLAGGMAATVHALDPWGMDVETDSPMAPGQLLDFELRQPGSRVKFAASGVVVQVRPHGTRLDVRIRFDALRLRAA